MFTWDEVSAFMQVVWIDLALAGDNAIIVGMVAAGLPRELRLKAIVVGIVVAVVMLICFAMLATQLLSIIGLLLAGGLLLLWVAWKLSREIASERRRQRAEALNIADNSSEASAEPMPLPKPKSFKGAVIQIIVADLSMSLDNVLAVAGAAREHPRVLIFGLALSVTLMAVAASYIARLLKRYHWIAYIGLAVILYVAGKMIYEGGTEVLAAMQGTE